MTQTMQSVRTRLKAAWPKLCALLVAVALCSQLLATVQDAWPQNEGRRLKYLPRYATEKEIRGSTYHVHHRIWVAGEEEGAPSDGKTVLTPGVTFNNVRRRLRPKYDVPGSWQKKASAGEGSRWFEWLR